MRRALVAAAALALLASPLPTAAQAQTGAQSSCTIIDTESPADWFRINPDRSWEALHEGVTYRSSGFDSVQRDPTEPAKVDLMDATGITINGSPAPVGFRLDGKILDQRDRGKVTFQLPDGQDEMVISDRAAPLDSHSFDCTGLLP